MIRIALPAHLRTLANVSGEVLIEVEGPVTQRKILDALESRHPVLRGTMRDHDGKKRRPFVRFFVGEEDRSHDDPDAPLPDQLVEGKAVFSVIGAMAGG